MLSNFRCQAHAVQICLKVDGAIPFHRALFYHVFYILLVALFPLLNACFKFTIGSEISCRKRQSAQTISITSSNSVDMVICNSITKKDAHLLKGSVASDMRCLMMFSLSITLPEGRLTGSVMISLMIGSKNSSGASASAASSASIACSKAARRGQVLPCTTQAFIEKPSKATKFQMISRQCIFNVFRQSLNARLLAPNLQQPDFSQHAEAFQYGRFSTT